MQDDIKHIKRNRLGSLRGLIEARARHQWLTPVILASGGRDQEDHGLKPTQANSS
jgi:hypothetical protein